MTTMAVERWRPVEERLGYVVADVPRSEWPPMIEEAKIVAVLEAERMLVYAALVHIPLVERYRLELEQAVGQVVPRRVAVCRGVGHCAIGALLFAAGVSDSDLDEMDDDPWGWKPEDEPARVLWAQYRLRPYHAQKIVQANDSDGDMRSAKRRDVVIRTVRELARYQRAYPELDRRRCAAFCHHVF